MNTSCRFKFSACSGLLKSKYLKRDLPCGKISFEILLITSFTSLSYGVPKGIRTPVTAVKGQCPGPLDDGDSGSTLLVTFSIRQSVVDTSKEGIFR